jgi:hypothetical protein
MFYYSSCHVIVFLLLANTLMEELSLTKVSYRCSLFCYYLSYLDYLESLNFNLEISNVRISRAKKKYRTTHRNTYKSDTKIWSLKKRGTERPEAEKMRVLRHSLRNKWYEIVS